MADNIFEKVDKQSEMLDSIVANQKQQSELLHQILGQMQNPKAAPQSGAAQMNAQIQRENVEKSPADTPVRMLAIIPTVIVKTNNTSALHFSF